MTDEKECFVISPIGSEESETRERADKLLEFIIQEALADYEFEVKRADEMSEPGSITSQVIENVVDSELVIADLTDHNPNVFYELAIRHATGKPYIQLIDSTQSIPFDIADLRTINYSFDVRAAANAVDKIKDQIDMIEGENPEFDSPISRSAELKSWRESDNPENRSYAEMADFMQQMARRMNSLERTVDQKVSIKRQNSLKDFVVNDKSQNGDGDSDKSADENIVLSSSEEDLKNIKIFGDVADSQYKE